MTPEEVKEKLDQLTKRQREVLALRCDGLDYEEIGKQLGIKKRTVKYHMGNVYSVLGFRDAEDQLDPQAERLKLLFEVYCRALEAGGLDLPPPEPEEPEPVSEEVIRMVEEDEHALAVWQGGEIVHVPMPEPTPPSPWWRWMRLLFVGLVLVILSSLLTVGILGALGILRDGSEQAASAGGITQAPEVVEDQSTETSPEIIIITTTPEPPPPTPLPGIQTEIIVVTPTPIPTSPTVPATDTSEPSPTPIPESTEEVDEQATETTPPPEASSPFSLPFVDNFDGGLQSEWEILNGDVFFGNGRLGASTEQVTLSIGDTLTDYEVSFDYWNLNLSSDYLALDVAPKLRYVQLRHVWRWYQFKDTEWVEIVYEPTGVPASGHMAIRREGNTITVLVNGQLHYEYTHNGTLEAGPFVITFGDDTQIDDFTIAAP